MINRIYKVGTAVATSAMILASFGATSFASTTSVTISGNGAFSGNTATVDNTTKTTVTQNNNADISNNVTTNANSGGNSAFDNTGGNTTIQTGNASSATNITNAANQNVAEVNNCGCSSDTTVKIAGNGALSDNNVDVDTSRNTTVKQTNEANVTNTVDATSKTGGNSAADNTGGNVSIQTGNASDAVNVGTSVNRNVATVGGTGSTPGGQMDLTITGNGEWSTNEIDANSTSNTRLDQSNNADIANNVTVKAKTGYNSAFDNTGGNTGIETGNAGTLVNVMNRANFNAANISCGCVSTADAVVTGNGALSGSNADLNLDHTASLGQGNTLDCGDCAVVDNTAKTGGNSNAFGTGSVMGDPMIMTGAAGSTTSVDNEANQNIFGSVSLPTDFTSTGSSNDWFLWLMGMGSNM